MSSRIEARNSIEKFKRKLEEVKKAGIGCGCGCGGIIDFENGYTHLEKNTFYPCGKCGLLHDFNGQVVFFKSLTKGYNKDLHVEYRPAIFLEDNPKEIGSEIDPKASPCHDNECAGTVDTTEKILIAFDTYSVCKKCKLLHTTTGKLQSFFKNVRGYLRNNEVVFDG